MSAVTERTISYFHSVHWPCCSLYSLLLDGPESSYANRKVKCVKSETSLLHYNLSLLPYTREAIKLSVVTLLLVTAPVKCSSYLSLVGFSAVWMLAFLIGNFSFPHHLGFNWVPACFTSLHSLPINPFGWLADWLCGVWLKWWRLIQFHLRQT